MCHTYIIYVDQALTVRQLYPLTDLFLHNNLFVSSHVYDTNLRDNLLGKDYEVAVDERNKLFHNTFKIHNLIYDFIKLNGNVENSEFKSSYKR